MVGKNKSQATVIVTVLIILLVLAAIAIVSISVMKTIREGTNTAEDKTACLSLSLSINDIANGSNGITINRATGGSNVNITQIKVFVDDKLNFTKDVSLDEVDTGTLSMANLSLKTGQKVQIAPVLEGNVQCDFIAETIVKSA